jgi:hypothetical protein
MARTIAVTYDSTGAVTTKQLIAFTAGEDIRLSWAPLAPINMTAIGTRLIFSDTPSDGLEINTTTRTANNLSVGTFYTDLAAADSIEWEASTHHGVLWIDDAGNKKVVARISASVAANPAATGVLPDPVDYPVSWAEITNKPTTLVGFGITDGQPLDGDLTAIAALAGTSGNLTKTAANTWALDTATYLSAATAAATYLAIAGGTVTGPVATSSYIDFGILNPSPSAPSAGHRVYTENGLTLVAKNAANQERQFAFLGDDGLFGNLTATEDITGQGNSLFCSTSGTFAFGVVAKRVTLDNSALSVARIVAFPDAAGTVVLADAAQTLTGKTIAGESNTLTVRLANDVTGTLGAANGGTGIANNAASTITISGNFGTTLTVTATTALTLPTTGTLATLAGTETLTNKRVTPRVGTTASSSAPQFSWDSHDQYNVTALAEAATIAAPAGTPTDGQRMLLRFKDNGTARALGYNAIFRGIGVTPPTTTVLSKTLYMLCVYNSADTKVDILAVGQEA